MPKATKGGFYAVRVGRKPGVYTTCLRECACRTECEGQIKGFTGAQHHKFKTQAEAEAYVKGVSTVGSSGKPYTKPESVMVSQKPRVTDLLQTPVHSVEEDEEGWDVIYTDGACRGNGKDRAVAGIGVWWGPNDTRNLSERCPGDQTNNRAELITFISYSTQAIVRALETTPFNKKPLLIKTDSQYSIKCFHEWLPKWKDNGWKTTQGLVKNVSLIQCLATLLDQRSRQGKVRLKYVAGHRGIEGNEGADRLAVAGTRLPSAEERDWDELRREVDRSIAGQMGAKPVQQVVEFEVTENDFWSQEELDEIEREMQA
ncbi:ribonuclease H-like protein [Neolentinus lepideus HHB14362 ss-1]|uniref:Ribonuclease H n=1 Tax=Neolentinus lepideus HHB14362 ss-1 TaxID=1314782 RepID=A0A165RJC5_9AGAM|nr:ribonuclease H-like protein [Neolentinus lepideus HHB14362 ss-1]